MISISCFIRGFVIFSLYLVHSAHDFPRPVGFWPLDLHHGDRDLGPHHRRITKYDISSGDCPFTYFGQGSFEFKGTVESYARILNGDATFNVEKEFTFMVWVKVVSQQLQTGPLFHFYDSSNHQHRLYIGLLSQELNYNTGSDYNARTNKAIPTNTWAAVAVIRDSTHYRMLVNGVEYIQERQTVTRNIAELSLHEWPLALGIWPLTERQGGADISGHDSHAELHDITYSTGPNGEERGAAEFLNSSHSYVELPNTDGKLNFYGSHTIALWLYVDDLDCCQQYPLLEQAPQAVNTLALEEVRRLWLHSDGMSLSSIKDFNGTEHITDSILTPSQWNWVVISHDQSRGVETVYVDDVEATSYPFNSEASSFAVDQKFKLGGSFGNHPSVFNGKVHCLQLYDFPVSTETSKLIQHKCAPQTLDLEETLVASFPLTHNLSDLKNPNRKFFAPSGNAYDWSRAELSYRGRRFGKSMNNVETMTLNMTGIASELNQCNTSHTFSFWMRYDNVSVRPTDSSVMIQILNLHDPSSYAPRDLQFDERLDVATVALNARSTASRNRQVLLNTQYERPLEEYLGIWRHFVLTSDSNIGISSLFIDGRLCSSWRTRHGEYEFEDASALEILSQPGQQRSFNCIQLYKGRVIQGQIIQIRDTCYADNTHDLLGPVAFWPLDQRYQLYEISRVSPAVLDLAGQRLQYGSGMDGKGSSAAIFYGTTAATVEHDCILNNRAAFSLLIWIYPIDFPCDSDCSVLTETQASKAVEGLYISAHHIIFVSTNLQMNVSTEADMLNTWTHISVILDDRFNALELYVNGSLRARKVQSNVLNLNCSDSKITLGASEDFNSFEGKLSCIQMYNYALTQEQRETAESFCASKDESTCTPSIQFMAAPSGDQTLTPNSKYLIHELNGSSWIRCLLSCEHTSSCLSAAHYAQFQMCRLYNITSRLSDGFGYSYTGSTFYSETYHPIDYSVV